MSPCSTKVTKNQPGVLLTSGDYYGSLAAARSLGKTGIYIIFADHRYFVPGKWSKYVNERVNCPPTDRITEFGNWLINFGKNRPGLVLYPTSDDLAWIISSRKDELLQFFKLYQPPLSTIYSLLNKKLLYKLVSNFDIKTPKTYFPKSFQELKEISSKIQFPVLVKPQTQMGLVLKTKGRISNNSEDLLVNVKRFLTKNSYHQEIIAYDNDVAWPMVQSYQSDATGHIHCIGGFVDESGDILLMKASQKLLQRPRRLGIGLCFEGRPILEKICEAIKNVCRKIKYFGVFEVEFIHNQSSGEYYLIDFNPRFYHQMAFEISRGLLLGELVYFAACKNNEMLQIISKKIEVNTMHKGVYSYYWLFIFLITTQWIGGRITFTQRQTWINWYKKNRNIYSDAVFQKGDKIPLLVDIFCYLKLFIRHPRAFIHNYFLDA